MPSTLSTKPLNNTEILTQITGKSVQSHHLTPRFLFLSAMTTVLVGVIYSDGQVADQEKSYLKKVFSQFAAPESTLGKILWLMARGIRDNRIYSNQSALTCLTQELSESEKLLILGFGCRVAVVDGVVEEQEREYLRQVAIALNISDVYAIALLSDSATDIDASILNELHCLLDPQRFQNLEPAIVKAASWLRSKLPQQAKPEAVQVRPKPSYEKLEKFEGFRGQLSAICNDLVEIVTVDEGQDLFPTVLEEDLTKLLQRIQSQQFRLAIVGEFSQGKSTLLNALLGEEIQPTRAIPCSGALTVLKYGPKKRAICHYTDGTQEVIPIDQYQEKASIPEEEAMGDRSHGLSESNIIEITLEHPGLELCRHHVEIIDSPGLNEHPDRTAITERLLKDTDAAIFLANASRPLTQGEKELLTSLKSQLQRHSPDEPADNLFVLANFMDLLRTQKNKEQVQQLFENFLQGDIPLITGNKRLHFVSAQAALEASLSGSEDEYSIAFTEFVSALETFLVDERGEIVLEKGIADIRRLIGGVQDGFTQKTNILEGNFSLSEGQKTKILEQIGDVSGFDIKVQGLRDELINEAENELCDSWNQWVENLEARIAQKSDYWTSAKRGKKSALEDYRKKFAEDFDADVDDWLKNTVAGNILKPKFNKLQKTISQKLATIRQDLKTLDNTTGASLDRQFDLSMSNLGIDMDFSKMLDPSSIEDATDFLGSLSIGGGFGGALVAAGFFFTGISMLPIAIAGGVVGAAASLFFSKSEEEVQLELKAEAFNKGIENFVESGDKIFDKIFDKIIDNFDERANAFHDAVSAAISILSNLLEQQENALKETVAQKESALAFIQQKRLELAGIEAALDTLTKTALS